MAVTDADIYTVGLVHGSICVPRDWTIEEIEHAANELSPTGIESRWKVDKQPTFATGQPNPCDCEHDPARKHYLLVC